MSIRIQVARTGGRGGFVIAAMPAPDYHSGDRLVVADFHRISADEEPEAWRSWLWPKAGGNLHTTQSCDVLNATSLNGLQAKLQAHADRNGAWWQ